MAGHIGPALRMVATVCHLTGRSGRRYLGDGRFVKRPYGGMGPGSIHSGGAGIAPSSVSFADTSCPRCGIRFPGPLGHKNQAAALLCPRFFRHTPRALAPQAARTSRCVAGAGGASGTAPQGEGGRTYKKRSRPGPGPFYGIVSCHGGAPYRALGAVQRSYSTCMTVATVWRP